MKNPAKNRVVIIGSSNTDLVLSCRELPRPGETVLGGEFARFAGGKGANQALAAARAGALVSFIGGHGDDEFGREAKRGLKNEKIDTRFFTLRKNVSSGVALILLGGKTRENMIGVARSANDEVSPEDVLTAATLLAKAKVVVAQLEIPLSTVEAAAESAWESKAIFILNPAPARKLPKSLLQKVGILTPNENEAELLTGKSDPSEAARVLLAQGVGRVAITLGAKGVLLRDESGERIIKAPRVKPLDTTGAGDCFSGWLAAGMAENLSFDAAAGRAVRAASVAVTRKGAQAGMPHRFEIVEN